jgi:hypothetical protein
MTQNSPVGSQPKVRPSIERGEKVDTPGSRREERFAGGRDGGDYVIGPVVVIRAMRIEKAHQSLVNRRAPKHFGTR